MEQNSDGGKDKILCKIFGPRRTPVVPSIRLALVALRRSYQLVCFSGHQSASYCINGDRNVDILCNESERSIELNVVPTIN